MHHKKCYRRIKKGHDMGKLSMELYLNSLSKRYRTGNKTEKGKILNVSGTEYCKGHLKVNLLMNISKNLYCNSLSSLVGTEGFEPSTPSTPC